MQLDDEEYSIPALDQLPTLENVLTDMAGDVDDSEAAASEFGGDFSATLMAGRSNGTVTPSSTLDDQQPARVGTILRHVMLQGVSAQIASAAVS